MPSSFAALRTITCYVLMPVDASLLFALPSFIPSWPAGIRAIRAPLSENGLSAETVEDLGRKRERERGRERRLFLQGRDQEPLVASLLLVVRPGALSGVLVLTTRRLSKEGLVLDQHQLQGQYWCSFSSKVGHLGVRMTNYKTH